MKYICNNTANEELRAKLRAMIEQHSLYTVASRLEIGREALLRYLANVTLNSTTFRGIEATLASAEQSSGR